MKVYVYLIFRDADDDFRGLAGVYATLKQAQAVKQYLGSPIHKIVAVPVAGLPNNWIAAAIGICLAVLANAIIRALF